MVDWITGFHLFRAWQHERLLDLFFCWPIGIHRNAWYDRSEVTVPCLSRKQLRRFRVLGLRGERVSWWQSFLWIKWISQGQRSSRSEISISATVDDGPNFSTFVNLCHHHKVISTSTYFELFLWRSWVYSRRRSFSGSSSSTATCKQWNEMLKPQHTDLEQPNIFSWRPKKVYLSS